MGKIEEIKKFLGVQELSKLEQVAIEGGVDRTTKCKCKCCECNKCKRSEDIEFVNP